MNLVRLIVFYIALHALFSAASVYAGNDSHGGGHGDGGGHVKPHVNAAGICQGFGPQAPRDITRAGGINRRIFTLAPPFERMNLCNIHTHTHAEHKGPGFSIAAGPRGEQGFKCNNSQGLTRKQLSLPDRELTYGNVRPGDTIEVHWVFTSCDADPGEGLGACLSESCTNPQLRVESQVFLLVNDRRALDFGDFDLDRLPSRGLHQPRRLPMRTGTPVEFAGSTTGPSYNRSHCSPLQVTWSVRPKCAMLDILSLEQWGSENAFNEHHSHGVRPLVTALDLLAPIE